MRTTLDIAEDVLQAAREKAVREGKTAGQVISDLARFALTNANVPTREVREPKAVYGFRAFAARGSIVTNGVIDKLREDDIY